MADITKPCPFCEIVHTVLVPHIHTNGTAAEDIEQELVKAIQALDTVLIALPVVGNARDYYLYTRFQISQGIKQHANRYDAIERVARELREILDHVRAVIAFKRSVGGWSDDSAGTTM